MAGFHYISARGANVDPWRRHQRRASVIESLGFSWRSSIDSNDSPHPARHGTLFRRSDELRRSLVRIRQKNPWTWRFPNVVLPRTPSLRVRSVEPESRIDHSADASVAFGLLAGRVAGGPRLGSAFGKLGPGRSVPRNRESAKMANHQRRGTGPELSSPSRSRVDSQPPHFSGRC